MKIEHISDLMLERYMLKELPERQIMEIDKLCEQSPDLKNRIDKIANSNAEILNRYPEDEIAAGIMRRYEMQKSGTENTGSIPKPVYKRFMIPSLVLVTAAALFFILPALKTSFYNTAENYLQEVTRPKGNESAIYLYRKSNNVVENLQEGSIAKKGDLLQVGYISAQDQYGIILSIDGRGTVTLHYPASKTESVRLITGKKVLLNNSYELDDAPDFERFFFITCLACKSGLNVSDVLDAARLLAGSKERLANGKIEQYDSKNGFNQTSIKIIKAR